MTAQELIGAYLAAARRGDWDTAFGFFADDILIHIPGRSRLAGDHRGRGAAIGYIQTIRDHYGEDAFELEVLEMLVGATRVALLVCERFLGDGPPVEIRRANLYRVDGDRVAEISIFEADQDVVDAMVSELALA